MYQRSKTLLTRFSQDNSEKSNSFSSVCKRFIGGTYLQKQQKDYIKNTKAGLEIEARDASSGQQELLPVLFMLFRKQHGLILIEEPETHIFCETTVFCKGMACLFWHNCVTCYPSDSSSFTTRASE